jgi:polyhydroxyalkanoate synthesis regulator phasin
MEKGNDRIKILIRNINDGTASTAEKKEYIQILLNEGEITSNEAEKYLREISKKETTDALIGIGAAIFLGWLISELFNKKD